MKYDAILILGGGLREGAKLPEHSKCRFDLALARQTGEPMVTLSAWTAHRPLMLDDDGRMITEALAGARYLMERGIHPSRIFCECTSYDTIGNAYFSRVQIIDPMGWRRLLIITSQFHIPRTEAIFRWIYGLDCAVPYSLEFAASPNEGLSPAALAARTAREQASLGFVEQHRQRMTSLRTVAEWLFTRHAQYTALREPPASHQQDLLDSY
jgi:hypothetical protein